MRRLHPTVVLIDVADGRCDAVAREVLRVAPGVMLVAAGTRGPGAPALPPDGNLFVGSVGLDASLGEVRRTVKHAIRQAAGTGRSPGGSHALARLFGGFIGTNQVRVTAREREIVALLDRGLTNSEIAERLSIRRSTVKNHVHNLFLKFHVDGRGKLACLLRSAPSTNGASFSP